MKYYEDMTSKYGFGDGDCPPPDAFAARAVYVVVINARAKQQGSGCRVYPYNRPGMHNPCMLVCAPAKCWDALAPDERRDGFDRFPEGPDSDSALANAIAWACDQRLDELVTTTTTIDKKRLRALLKQTQGKTHVHP